MVKAAILYVMTRAGEHGLKYRLAPTFSSKGATISVDIDLRNSEKRGDRMIFSCKGHARHHDKTGLRQDITVSMLDKAHVSGGQIAVDCAVSGSDTGMAYKAVVSLDSDGRSIRSIDFIKHAAGEADSGPAIELADHAYEYMPDIKGITAKELRAAFEDDIKPKLIELNRKLSEEWGVASVIDEDKIQMHDVSASLLPVCGVNRSGTVLINKNFVRVIALLKKRFSHAGLDRGPVLTDEVTGKSSPLLDAIIYAVVLHELTGHFSAEGGAAVFTGDEAQAQKKRGEKYAVINIKAMLYFWLVICEKTGPEALSARAKEFLERHAGIIPDRIKGRDETYIADIIKELERLSGVTADALVIGYKPTGTDRRAVEVSLPAGFAFNEGLKQNGAPAAESDYMRLLKLKFIQSLEIPEADAAHYAEELLSVHTRLQRKVVEFYGDTENELRYTLTPRELHRARDDLIKYFHEARRRGDDPKKALQWAFNNAVQDVYYDLFPEEFFRSAGGLEGKAVPDESIWAGQAIKDETVRRIVEKVGPYQQAYGKLARGVFSGKPILFIKDPESFDTAEFISEIYVRERGGFFMKVPITPFTDRSQIIGTQVPKDPMTAEWAKEILGRATPQQVKWALAILRDRVPRDSAMLSEEELDKIIGTDYREWLILKDTHEGLYKAVASAVLNGWGWTQKLEYADGVLTKLAIEAAMDPKGQFYVLFDNIDAASPKVRAQLNMILLFGYMEIPEKTGGERRLKLPPNLHLIFTMSSRSNLEDAAFYDRFLRKHLDPIAGSRAHFNRKVNLKVNVSIDELFRRASSYNLTVKNQLLALLKVKIGSLALSSATVREYSKMFTDSAVARDALDLHYDSVREELARFLLKHPECVKEDRLFTEDEISDFFGIAAKYPAVVADDELAWILRLRYGLDETAARLLVEFWNRFMVDIQGTEAAEDAVIGDLFRIGMYVKGILDANERPAGYSQDEFIAEVIAEEAWFYLRNKLAKYFELKKAASNALVQGKLLSAVQAVRKKPGLFDFNDTVSLNGRAHKLVVNGVAIDIDPAIVNERTLFEKTGLVLTGETKKVLSALVREDLFGNGVIRLEGPTGTGKTFIAEAYSKLVMLNGGKTPAGRLFYCEPIHSSSRLDKWLGYYRVDRWGDYPLFDDTQFRTVLERGGVAAASELNTRVDRDGKASLGYWLIPKARGDSGVPLTEQPRNIRGKHEQIPWMELDPRSLVVVDVNPEEGYAARGEMPDFLKAYTPAVYVSNDIPLQDVTKLVETFLADSAFKGKAEVCKYVAGVHHELHNNMFRLAAGADENYILTIRELWRVCEDIRRCSASGQDPVQAATRSLYLNYAKFWASDVSRLKVEGLIERIYALTITGRQRMNPRPPAILGGPLAGTEQDAYECLKDSLAEAGRPTMLISPVDSRPKAVVSRLVKDRFNDSRTMTISHFTELFNLVGGFVPVNFSISRDEALAIIERIYAIDRDKVKSIWFGRMRMAEEDIEEAPAESVIALATALSSLEKGEAWNAKLEWKDGFISKAVKQYGSSGEKALLILDNYHRLRPKVAVALNELLQGRQMHLEDGSILSLPANISILALCGSSIQLPLSPAEQSRWVRISADELTADEKIAILRAEVRDAMGRDDGAVNAIVEKVLAESGQVDLICKKSDYYFSFWDDVALARAIVAYIKRKGELSEGAILEAVRKERLSVYGIALRPDEFSQYVGPEGVMAYRMQQSTVENGEFVIDGAGYPIADSALSASSKEKELIEIPGLLVRERSMINALRQDRIVVMEGPPGGGKTDTAVNLARRIGLDSFVFSSHDRVHLSDFIGEFTQNEGGNYALTSLPDASGHYNVPFLELYTHGGVYVVDEGAIGQRAQQLIAWLGPIAAGEKELYLNELPGAQAEALQRHKDFKIVITTNPYSDTPGREALPFEVLSRAQKIWVGNDFEREDFQTILRSDMKDFGLLSDGEKESFINRMIDFHFRVEERIGITLGTNHEERCYIGIRELKRWMYDFQRIYRSGGGRNAEFAFIEAMALNYSIFVEDEEQKAFAELVLKHLLLPRLAEATTSVVTAINTTGEFSFEPLDEVFEAYQTYFVDPDIRQNVCASVNAAIKQKLGIMPEVSINKYYNLATAHLRDLVERSRAATGNMNFTYMQLELYAKEDAEQFQKAVASLAIFLGGIPAFQGSKAQTTLKLQNRTARFDDVFRPYEAHRVDFYSGAFATLASVLALDAKHRHLAKISQHTIVNLLSLFLTADALSADDKREFIPDVVKQLYQSAGVLSDADRTALLGSLADFVNKAYLDSDDPLLVLKGMEMGLYHFPWQSQKGGANHQELVRSCIGNYHRLVSEKHDQLKEHGAAFGAFWSDLGQTAMSMTKPYRMDVAAILEKRIDSGAEIINDLPSAVFTYDERIAMAFSALELLHDCGDEEKLRWIGKIEELLRSAYGASFGFNLAASLRDAENAAKKAVEDGGSAETAAINIAGSSDAAELFGKIKSAAMLRSYLLRLSRAVPGLSEELQEAVLARIVPEIPDSACEKVCQALMGRRGGAAAAATVWDDILKWFKDPPDHSAIDLALTTGRLVATGDPLGDILEKTRRIEIKGSQPDRVRELVAHLAFFEKALELSGSLDKDAQEEIAMNVFKQMSAVSYNAIQFSVGQLKLVTLDDIFDYNRVLRMIQDISRRNKALKKKIDAYTAELNKVDLSEHVQTYLRDKIELKVEEENGNVRIGYVSLPKGKPLDVDKVPAHVPWVKGIYSEESVLRFMANCFASARPCLLFNKAGSRVNVIIDRLCQLLSWEKHQIDCYADMTVSDLLGGLSPLLDSPDGSRKRLTQERGLLSSLLVDDGKKDALPSRKVLALYNIDFLSEKVRAALHNFLLKGYIYVIDDSGVRRRLVKPDSLNIVVTMSADSNREMADAFFNRFSRTSAPALEMKKKGYGEFEKVLKGLYGLPPQVSRGLTRVVYAATVLDERLLWPSGMTYGFSVKEGFALARSFVQAREEYRRKGADVPDMKILCREAMRLFGGALSDKLSVISSGGKMAEVGALKGISDRDEFFRLAIRSIFTSKDIDLPANKLTLDAGGRLIGIDNVELAPTKSSVPIFEIDQDHRLSFVPALIFTAGAIARAWQSAWDRFRDKTGARHQPELVLLMGETGVAKTTLGINLALSMGVKPYVYSTHHGSHVWDLTVDIAPDGKGGYGARIKDFAKMAEDGNSLLIVDEGNIKSQLIQALAPVARGETKIKLVLPGEGRRLSRLLFSIINDISDMDIAAEKLRLFGLELFGERQRRFDGLLGKWSALPAGKERREGLGIFHDLAVELGRSGPFEVKLGENVFILVTENPESYAGRDNIDPVIQQDARKVWASSIQGKDEALAIVNAFLGLLPSFLTDPITVDPRARKGAYEPPKYFTDVPLDALRLGSVFPLRSSSTFIDKVKVKLSESEQRVKRALIERDIAFYTNKKVSIVPADEFAISSDGTKIFVPYHQLLYSPPDVITGSIIHEIRHQRYTLSYEEVESLAADLLQEGAITADECAAVCKLSSDRHLNGLYQLAENVRTDSIEEPGFEGENEYILSFRKEMFMDNRLESLPEGKRGGMKKEILAWANAFPDQAFITELANLAYFKKHSAVFEEYPGYLKDAVRGAAEPFLKATVDREVKPLFDTIESEEDFEKEKRRAVKVYIFRLVKDIMPAYLTMVGKAAQSYADEEERARKTSEDFREYMEPYVKTEGDKQGRERIVRSRTEAQLSDRLKGTLDNLKDLLHNMKELKKVLDKKSDIDPIKKILQGMQSAVKKSRELTGSVMRTGVAGAAVSDEARNIRDEIFAIFRGELISVGEAVSDAYKKAGNDEEIDQMRQRLIAKSREVFSKLEAKASETAEKIDNEMPLAGISAAADDMSIVLDNMDAAEIELAALGAGTEALEHSTAKSGSALAISDRIDMMIGQRQSLLTKKSVQREFVLARAMTSMNAIKQEAASWARVMSSNPLIEQVLEAHVGLSRVLQEAENAVFAMSAMFSDENTLSVARGVRKEVLGQLARAEDLVRELRANERSGEAPPPAEEAARLIETSLQNAKETRDVAVTKTETEDIRGCHEIVMKEIAELQKLALALADEGAGDELIKKVQEARGKLVGYADEIDGLMKQRSSKEAKRGTSPVEEMLLEVIRIEAQSKDVVEKLEHMGETARSLKDITDALDQLGAHMKSTIAIIHNAAYLKVNDDLLGAMNGYLKEVVKYFDKALLLLSAAREDRFVEFEADVAEEAARVQEEYEKAQNAFQSVENGTSIVRTNLFESNLIELIDVINHRIIGMADKGAQGDHIDGVKVKRDRLMALLMRSEKMLRDMRMMQQQGKSSMNIELLISRILKAAEEAFESIGDGGQEKLAEVSAKVKSDLMTLHKLLLRMYVSGSPLGLMKEATAARERILELIDRIHMMIREKACVRETERKAPDEIHEKIAGIWKGSRDIREKAAGSDKVKELIAYMNSLDAEVSAILEQADALAVIGPDPEELRKAAYSRNGVMAVFDEVGMSLHEAVLQELRKASGKRSGAKGGGRQNFSSQEAELDAVINKLLGEASAMIDDLAKNPSRQNAAASLGAIADRISSINDFLMYLSAFGVPENLAGRVVEARNVLWKYYKEVSAVLRRDNHPPDGKSAGEVSGLRSQMSGKAGTCAGVRGRISSISPIDEISAAAEEFKGYLNDMLSLNIKLDILAAMPETESDKAPIEEAFIAFDELAELFREMIRAYNQLNPPSPGGEENGGGGGAEMAGGGMMQSDGGSMSDQGGAVMGGDAGGGGAGKGAPARAPLAGHTVPEEGDDTSPRQPLRVDAPAGKESQAKERGPRGAEEAEDQEYKQSEDELEKLGDDITQNRLEEIRKNDNLRSRVSTSSARARKDANRIIRLFKQKDADVIIEEAPTGLMLDIPRFIRGDPESFVVEHEHLGDVSLAFGLYVDNSGSIGAIKEYVADAASYIIHLFEGICGTRTGKDKFAYSIKTFDSGMNSFKEFGEKMSKNELKTVPSNLKSILGTGRTDISLCISSIIRDFRNVKEKTKVAVLITDGQDSVDPGLARKAADEGITLIGIGIGSDYSGNVRNIFERYMILSNPKEELPNAIVRMASMLATGKKLPLGDLRGAMGLEPASYTTGPGLGRGSKKDYPDMTKAVSSAGAFNIARCFTLSLLSAAALSGCTFIKTAGAVWPVSMVVAAITVAVGYLIYRLEKTKAHPMPAGPAAPSPAKTEPDAVPARGPGHVDDQDLAGRVSAMAPFMRDITAVDESVTNFIEAAVSACISNEEKKVVLAFHKDLMDCGTGEVSVRYEKLRQIVREIEKLKKRDGVGKLLKNLVVIGEFEDLRSSLEKEGLDPETGGDLIFMFAPLMLKDSLKGLPGSVRSVYINEHIDDGGRRFDKLAFYYPLLEVVTIALLKYLGKDDNAAIDLEKINIRKVLADRPGAFLVFDLIPKAAAAETERMRDRYLLERDQIASAS